MPRCLPHCFAAEHAVRPAVETGHRISLDAPLRIPLTSGPFSSIHLVAPLLPSMFTFGCVQRPPNRTASQLQTLCLNCDSHPFALPFECCEFTNERVFSEDFQTRRTLSFSRSTSAELERPLSAITKSQFHSSHRSRIDAQPVG